MENITADGIQTRETNKNISDSDLGDFYRHSFPITAVLICACAVILLIGTVGNSLVVIVVLRSPRMRTVTNLFIMNLATADLLVVFFCLPPNLLSNILVPWVLGRWMCKTVPYVQGVSVCASVYSLVAVSLDRFIAIWFPLWGGLTKGKARLIIVLIWAVSLTLSVPFALYFDLVEYGPAEFCVETDKVKGDMYFLVGNLFFCYLFPLSGISLCYLLIWVRVLRRHVPTDALFLRMKFGSPLSPAEEKVVAIATPIAQWLGSSNSCINPVLYAYLNVKFRRAFQSLQPECCRSQTSYNHTSTKSSLLIVPRQPTSVYRVTTTGV